MHYKNGRNLRFAALGIALVMLAGMLAGCKATIDNPVVAKVGDVEITYSTYYNQFSTFKQYADAGYLAIDDGKDQMASLRELTFKSVIDAVLPLAWAHKIGLTLTEGEQTIAMDAADVTLKGYVEQYASQIDESITDETEKYDAEYALLIKELKSVGMTYEKLTKQVREASIEEALAKKMADQVKAEASVTDEQIQEWYDNTVKEQTATFAEKPESYYSYVQQYAQYGGVEPLVAPDGYYYYKHILIKNPAEGETKDVNTIVTEVQAKLASGADFDALIKDYGEDPGMASEQYAKGYVLSESNRDSYYAEFSDAALALAKVGDVSGPVKSKAGVHIIKKVAAVDTAPKTLEEVKTQIHDYLLATHGDELYMEAASKWIEELKIVKYESRVKYVGMK
ncbi:MAG: peptidylprolyl isomerase [Clostridia bacterium]